MTLKQKMIGWLAVALTAGTVPVLAAGTDKWQEEILLQLSELRKSQGDLIKQVASLSAEVASLKAAAAAGSGTGSGRRMSLDLRDSSYPFTGSEKAQVAIVEFSDFECPYCRRHSQGTLRALQTHLDAGTVRYYFVDFPLSFHSQAVSAAIAGACAHDQGKFWGMHDSLFQNQSRLGQDLYLKLAGDLSLNRGTFEACLADPKTKLRIVDHTRTGEQMGVQGTPAFVIGRVKDGVLVEASALSGAKSIGEFEKVLGRYLPAT